LPTLGRDFLCSGQPPVGYLVPAGAMYKMGKTKDKSKIAKRIKKLNKKIVKLQKKAGKLQKKMKKKADKKAPTVDRSDVSLV
jgi:prefoldin subunit 5